MGEVEELQAHVRKFEAHLNDLELELHVTAHERDEARQRAERAEEMLRKIRWYAPYEYEAALAAGPRPAEAGGEVATKNEFGYTGEFSIEVDEDPRGG